MNSIDICKNSLLVKPICTISARRFVRGYSYFFCVLTGFVFLWLVLLGWKIYTNSIGHEFIELFLSFCVLLFVLVRISVPLTKGARTYIKVYSDQVVDCSAIAPKIIKWSDISKVELIHSVFLGRGFALHLAAAKVHVFVTLANSAALLSLVALNRPGLIHQQVRLSYANSDKAMDYLWSRLPHGNEILKATFQRIFFSVFVGSLASGLYKHYWFSWPIFYASILIGSSVGVFFVGLRLSVFVRFVRRCDLSSLVDHSKLDSLDLSLRRLFCFLDLITVVVLISLTVV